MVKAYGFFMGLAAFAVLAISILFLKKLGLPLKRCLPALLGMAVAMPIGARALHIFINPSYYALYPERATSLNTAGFSLMGGVILAAVVGSIVIWIQKLPYLRLADAIAPGLGIGLAFMRMGCFLNGCCFGMPCHLPWAVRFPYGSPAHQYYVMMNVSKGFTLGQLVGSPSLHPTQLYEMLAALLAAGFAVYLINRKAGAGLPFLGAALLFTVARLGNHFLRVKPLTSEASQWFFPGLYAVLIFCLISSIIIVIRWDQD